MALMRPNNRKAFRCEHKNSNTTQRYLHRLTEMKTALQALAKTKSRLAEPSTSTKRRTKLRVVNN